MYNNYCINKSWEFVWSLRIKYYFCKYLRSYSVGSLLVKETAIGYDVNAVWINGILMHVPKVPIIFHQLRRRGVDRWGAIISAIIPPLLYFMNYGNNAFLLSNHKWKGDIYLSFLIRFFRDYIQIHNFPSSNRNINLHNLKIIKFIFKIWLVWFQNLSNSISKIEFNILISIIEFNIFIV